MPARWRLALRIARRDAARHRARSALVAGLVALPVALLAGAVTLWATTHQSPDQQATAVMGGADAMIELHEGPAARADWRAELPEGARAVPVDTSRPLGVLAGGERHDLAFTGALLGDPLTDGLVDLVAGRAPAAPREAAVSPPVLADLDVAIGDELVLADLDATLEITGVVERPARLSASDVVVIPGALPGQLDSRRWLVETGPAGVAAVGDAIGAAFGGTPADPGVPALVPRDHVVAPDDETLSMLAVLGGLALTEAAIVASAAFAVGLRRQLRDLGLIAAAGGRGRDLRRVVVAGGLRLGALGALVGGVLGIAAVAGMAPFLDGWLDRRVGGLEVPVRLVAAAMAAGVVAALAAAAAPARTAGRVPVTAALAGTRPVTQPTRRGIVAGIVVVVLGSGVLAAAAGNADLRLSTAPAIAVITCGAILVVLGFTFASPAMAGLLGRMATRAPTGARLALRDLARHRVRTGPAISAVMAALALPIAVGMFLASTDARISAARLPGLAPEHVLLEATPPEDDRPPHRDRVDAVAEAVGARSRVTLTALGSPGSPHERYGPPVEVQATVATPVRDGTGLRRGRVAAVDDPGSALDAWGVADEERPAATEALEDGGVVLFGVEGVHGTTALVRTQDETLGRVPAAGVRADRYQQLPWGVTTRQTADDLGLAASREQVLLRADSPPDEDARAAAAAAAGSTGRAAPDGSIVEADDDAVLVRFHQPASPAAGTGLRWITLGGATAVAAGIVVVALALAAAEGRGDRATLAAVGADRTMRRRFRAAQALALTLAAGVLAVPAGILPPAVTLIARDPTHPLRLPWEAVLVAVIGLPFLAWATVRLLAREQEHHRPATWCRSPQA